MKANRNQQKNHNTLFDSKICGRLKKRKAFKNIENNR